MTLDTAPSGPSRPDGESGSPEISGAGDPDVADPAAEPERDSAPTGVPEIGQLSEQTQTRCPSCGASEDGAVQGHRQATSPRWRRVTRITCGLGIASLGLAGLAALMKSQGSVGRDTIWGNETLWLGIGVAMLLLALFSALISRKARWRCVKCGYRWSGKQ